MKAMKNARASGFKVRRTIILHSLEEPNAGNHSNMRQVCIEVQTKLSDVWSPGSHTRKEECVYLLYGVCIYQMLPTHTTDLSNILI